MQEIREGNEIFGVQRKETTNLELFPEKLSLKRKEEIDFLRQKKKGRKFSIPKNVKSSFSGILNRSENRIYINKGRASEKE